MWFKHLLLGVLLLPLLAISAFGQVVTPSLDPAIPAELSSAVAWRFGSAFGVKSIYRKEKSETTENDYYYDKSGVLFAYQPGYVIGELYAESTTRQSIWDPSTDTFTDSTGTFAKLNLAIRGENRVSVGIGYGSTDQKIADMDGLRNTFYEGSFSIRLFGGFYLAGGLQRVTERLNSGASRKWNSVLAGAAVQFGDPFSSMFKLEGSLKLSPEVDFNEQTNYAIHRQSTTLNATAEAVYSSFLFSYRYKNTTHYAPTDQEDDIETSEHQYGVGIKLGGFTFGLYRIAGLETVGEKDLSTEEVMATVSYNFI